MVFFTACNDDVMLKQEKIDQEVKSAIEAYRNKRMNECLVSILDSANTITDSLIVQKMTAMDTMSAMGKPLKPIKPIIKSPLDTTPVKPIIPKN